ncbi:hypothetical protein Q1695_008708 [Nippostrongylus brasiliensis]|nr:hypothetical protein Q1695_008708 [Nippostrongylus brasiliensis]
MTMNNSGDEPEQQSNAVAVDRVWSIGSQSPTIDVMSEASPSPQASSSNSDSVVADCVVCGDKSSGKHYGQFSCEGCKSFFKRSIRRSLSYACRGTKNCPVDVNHRNQCQFCRLKKCIKMGMRREAVQRGRMHNGPSFLSYLFPPPFVPRPPLPFFHPLMMNFPKPTDNRLTDTETPTLPSCFPPRDVGTNFLYSTVDWARQLSFFSDLTQQDQVTLLQSSWVQLFVLCAAGSAVPLTTSEEINAKNGSIYLEHVERLRSIHMDFFELNSVKAAVLFNPDIQALNEPLKVETIQEKIQATLDEYCRTQKAHQPGRFGRILLRLPSLRSLDASTIESLFFSRLETSVPAILKDLLNKPVLIPKLWPYPMFPQLPVPQLT